MDGASTVSLYDGPVVMLNIDVYIIARCCSICRSWTLFHATDILLLLRCVQHVHCNKGSRLFNVSELVTV